MIPLNASGSRALFLVFACAKMPPISLQRCIEALSCHLITSDNRSSRK
jgi:hypothetical protein